MRLMIHLMLVATIAAATCMPVFVPISAGLIFAGCLVPGIFLLILLFSGTRKFKKPAWLTLPAAFGMWAAAIDVNRNPNGYYPYGIVFALIGFFVGLAVETHRSKADSISNPSEAPIDDPSQ